MTAGLPRTRLVRSARNARLRKLRRATHPLAYARLWDNPAPRTSQRRALRMLARNCVALAIFGGNGSGKTEVAAQLAVAVALGRGHPDALAWCEANGIAPEVLPPYPGRVLFSALTSNDSRRVLRVKAARYAPPTSTWRNQGGDGEAELRMPNAVGNNGVIVFKSNDQGRRAYQADEFDVVILDEEHDADVMTECLTRIGRRAWKGGYIVLSMTPLKGFTWVYEDFQGKPKPDYLYAEIHGKDNPHLDQKMRAKIYAGLTDAQRAARELGKFTVMEGLVYPEFSRELHVIPSFPIPETWPRFISIDFGTRNPACILWFAVAPDEQVHIYREYYRPSTTAELGDALRQGMKLDPEPSWIVADPENLDARITLRNDFDVITEPANKAIAEGINDVHSLLMPDGNGKPGLVYHDCCTNTIRETQTYVYPDAQGKRGPQENPLKRDDHAQDAKRYGIRFFKLRGA